MDAKRSPARLVLVLWMIVLASGEAGAQTRPQSATLRVTVKDPSGAVIPGAAVQLCGSMPAPALTPALRR